ncbi:hypothetical protein J2Z40_002786 [Cytobacillus eiseniae]|uniref:DUF3889 domain-containing protein n=1 Tax=Cytobacillus eiseniae TaxID=762947 RepID=A0ABS4RHI9_9BACI|nr:DUF3889 domain-containing protein [Cytobacillus eiseniae]MBP2242213.1 hypothetical protein [Cytobacillus eiseniae]
MKRYLLIFAIISLFFNGWIGSSFASEKPDYEKYGRIATAVVIEDYPGEEVVEYEYTGRQKLTETNVTDSFTFQVKEDGKPVTVVVKITHSLDNSKTLTMSVEEKQG